MSTEKEIKLEQNKLDESQKQDNDWKRVREEIEHENTLVNHRLSWLGTLQALLFAAFGVVLNAYASEEIKNVSYSSILFILFVIGFLGMLICFFIWMTLKQAQRQLNSLDCWWYCEDRSKITDKNQWDKLISCYQKEDLWVKKLTEYPPIQIYKSRSFRFIPGFIVEMANDYNIPLIFIGGWITILAAVLLSIV